MPEVINARTVLISEVELGRAKLAKVRFARPPGLKVYGVLASQSMACSVTGVFLPPRNTLSRGCIQVMVIGSVLNYMNSFY